MPDADRPDAFQAALDETQAPMARLLAVMRALRDREHGCPWDRKQDFSTIAPYTIEEAYEVADAVERGRMDDLREELGDLLFQVVFHAQMADESGQFSFDDVARAIADKMVRRHPHVFGSAVERDAAAQTRAWEAQKAEERARKGGDDASVLADIPLALPALTRAEKIMKRAARVGFDWPTIEGVFAKIDEELAETREAVGEGDPDHVAEEIGDLLSTVVNLARKLKIDPEAALRASNAKFERRFRSIEQALETQGRSPAEATLDEMEALWLKAKTAERAR